MQCADPPTYAVSPIDLIQSGWSLIYCTALIAYSQPISLSISYTEMCVAYIISLTCWHVKTNMHMCVKKAIGTACQVFFFYTFSTP